MRWLISASVFHIEEPVGSYDCFRHFIIPPVWGGNIYGCGKVPKFWESVS